MPERGDLLKGLVVLLRPQAEGLLFFLGEILEELHVIEAKVECSILARLRLAIEEERRKRLKGSQRCVINSHHCIEGRIKGTEDL